MALILVLLSELKTSAKPKRPGGKRKRGDRSEGKRFGKLLGIYS